MKGVSRVKIKLLLSSAFRFLSRNDLNRVDNVIDTGTEQMNGAVYKTPTSCSYRVNQCYLSIGLAAQYGGEKQAWTDRKRRTDEQTRHRLASVGLSGNLWQTSKLL